MSISNVKLFKYLGKAVNEIKQDGIKPKFQKTKLIYPFKLMLHPVETCEDVKYFGAGSMMIANILALAYFLSLIFKAQYLGYVFNYIEKSSINYLMIFSQSVLTTILWAFSSWAIGVLINGEGKLKDLWILFNYANIPRILSIVPITLLSNGMVAEEAVLIKILFVIFEIWSLGLLFMIVMTMHQFTIVRTAVSIGLTIVCVQTILFVFVLFIILYQKVYAFIATVYQELMFRIQ